MKQKLTPWFPPDVEPVREGVYQLLNTSTGREFYARWIVKEDFYYLYKGWSTGHMLAKYAAREHEFGLVQYRWQWRGIQGDVHSVQVGASAYLVEFSEGPDRPGDDE